MALAQNVGDHGRVGLVRLHPETEGRRLAEIQDAEGGRVGRLASRGASPQRDPSGEAQGQLEKNKRRDGEADPPDPSGEGTAAPPGSSPQGHVFDPCSQLV
jgi:hypothetical protein